MTTKNIKIFCNWCAKWVKQGQKIFSGRAVDVLGGYLERRTDGNELN
jgi:hypothetical protein